MPDALTARARWAALVVVCFAQFMVVLDATIVNVALPSIQTDLNLSTEQLQWIVNAYTLMFGGFLLLGGRAADLIGRRRLFLIGIALFSAASAANALANTGEVLIIARGVQGLGAALVSPAALSIITTTFAEGKDRTRAMGVWGAIAGAGGAFGLLLGGILTDVLSWPWIFLINVPIGHRHRDRRAALRPRVARADDPPALRPRRRGDRHRGPDRARLRDRQGAGEGLGLAAHARPQRRRHRAAGRLRGHRAPLGRAARAPRDLPRSARWPPPT